MFVEHVENEKEQRWLKEERHFWKNFLLSVTKYFVAFYIVTFLLLTIFLAADSLLKENVHSLTLFILWFLYFYLCSVFFRLLLIELNLIDVDVFPYAYFISVGMTISLVLLTEIILVIAFLQEFFNFSPGIFVWEPTHCFGVVAILLFWLFGVPVIVNCCSKRIGRKYLEILNLKG